MPAPSRLLPLSAAHHGPCCPRWGEVRGHCPRGCLLPVRMPAGAGPVPALTSWAARAAAVGLRAEPVALGTCWLGWACTRTRRKGGKGCGRGQCRQARVTHGFPVSCSPGRLAGSSLSPEHPSCPKEPEPPPWCRRAPAAVPGLSAAEMMQLQGSSVSCGRRGPCNHLCCHHTPARSSPGSLQRLLRVNLIIIPRGSQGQELALQ